MIKVSRCFSYKNINLVVEVTERNTNHCDFKLMKNMKYLQSSGVCLALDDYDFVKEDFREIEREIVRYDFIKVYKPECKNDIDSLNKMDLQGSALIIDN